MMVLRADLTLSRRGLLGPSSTKLGGDEGTCRIGGRGGRSSTGRGVSLGCTLFTRTGAVGGGGSHGWRALSASDESPGCAMAIVPRLRDRLTAAPPNGRAWALTSPISPRPHLQPSMSLGAGREAAPLVRFHKHPEVMAEKEKSTHRAMLSPQMDLIW